MTEPLRVFLDGHPVGLLTQSSNGAITFDYDDGYRSAVDATPLSLSMPLVRRTHRHRPTRAFLEGLLPDSESRLRELGREYGISPNNPFALLAHVGRDAAGAVQILPQGEASTDAAGEQGDVSVLSDSEFAGVVADIIANRDSWGRRTTNGAWSLPGAQPKVALFRTGDGRWAVPNDATPTTHIVKPAVPPYPEHHINEYVTMAAARHLGLDVAHDTMIVTELGDAAFVAERYDRVEHGGRWHRVHQEDLCQALSVPPAKKYQSEGGPGVGAIAQLFAGLPDPDDRRMNGRRFFDALAFNLAMQGTDAHAKNYSLILSGEGARLAPLYDLGSHAPYPSSPGRPLTLAMSIEGEYRLAAVSLDALVRTGRRLGLPEDEARERAGRILGGVVAAYAAGADEARAIIGDHPFTALLVDSIAEYVRERGWAQDG